MDHYSCKRRFRQRSCIAVLLGALAAQAGELVGPPAAAEEGEIGAQPAAESPLGEAEESSAAAVVERAAEIGRASCRDREVIWADGASVREENVWQEVRR